MDILLLIQSTVPVSKARRRGDTDRGNDTKNKRPSSSPSTIKRPRHMPAVLEADDVEPKLSSPRREKVLRHCSDGKRE